MKKLLLATTLILPLAGVASAEGTLNIYAWADSISPDLIAKFTEETGIEVNVDNAKAFIDFMSTVENATEQYNYYAHSAPVEIDESKALYTPENAPELFPTVPVVFAQACSPAAQDLVTKVWTDLLQ
ncbi:hypothetical protein [uncultured Celeribacter sp.]|uniref:hypothetical protein n=1 Tax=uncultured Celeribacter sp. TaxID=1303376 RepID=UPI002AA6A281|nr:hypothetical protein [uncultured Celeribacter sp.]